MLRAMRAGASDFLMQPFATERLRVLFQRIKRKRRSKAEPPPARGRVIAFMGARGGCGTSTVALHVAARIAQTKKRRVLLADLDVHCGAFDFRLQLRPQYTLGEALEHINEIHDVWEQLRIEWKNLDLLPAPSLGEALPPNHLENVPALLHYTSGVYAVTVADMPAAFLAACPGVVERLDTVFVVTTPGLASLHLARRRIRELQSAGRPGKQVGLVVNRFGSTSETLAVKKIEEVVGAPVLAKLNDDSSTAQAAVLAAGLIPGNSALGRQYGQLSRQILGLRAEEERRGRGFLSKLLLPQSA